MKTIFLILKWLFILLVLVFALSVVYEQYARYDVKKNFIDNGTYVEVDGHKMHYVKCGEGTPTVIFESGLDFSGHMSWYKVQEKVSKFATTISYDRFGILRSEKSNKPRTCENIAEELHTLLEKIEAKKPYILVAHSLGGLIARCYVKEYADTLNGIVFVDASHPEMLERAPVSVKEMMKSSEFPSGWIKSLLDYTGLTRLAINSGVEEFVNDDKNIKAIQSEINTFLIESTQGIIEEDKMFEEMLRASKGVTFGDIPLTILSATEKPSSKEEHVLSKFFRQLQQESLELSTKSKLISVDSGHIIQLEKPEVVVGAIREMVEDK